MNGSLDKIYFTIKIGKIPLIRNEVLLERLDNFIRTSKLKQYGPRSVLESVMPLNWFGNGMRF